MKFRNGFVTNSSSSSYLVVFKTPKSNDPETIAISQAIFSLLNGERDVTTEKGLRERFALEYGEDWEKWYKEVFDEILPHIESGGILGSVERGHGSDEGLGADDVLRAFREAGLIMYSHSFD